jgi:hypothetical protein
MYPGHRTESQPMKKTIFAIIVGWFAAIGLSEVFNRIAEYLTGKPQEPPNILALGFCMIFLGAILSWLNRRQQPPNPHGERR